MILNLLKNLNNNFGCGLLVWVKQRSRVWQLGGRGIGGGLEHVAPSEKRHARSYVDRCAERVYASSCPAHSQAYNSKYNTRVKPQDTPLL